MKLSHSSLSLLTTCGQKFKYSYVDKLTTIWQSSALKFGSAMDAALNHMLVNKDVSTVLQDSLLIFEQEWTSQKERGGRITYIPENPLLTYSKSDFDQDLLDGDDIANLPENWEERFESIRKKKEVVPWKDMPEKDRAFYNYVNWLSLRQKGRIMVEAYYKYIIPDIVEVLDVQKHISVDNGDGSVLHGYVDLVIRLKDGSVAVMDNKTSSIDYEDDSASFSPQLTLYMMLLNNMNLSYKVDKVGYIVLSKKILKEKTKVCSKCGYQADAGSSHKTCNNEVGGKRCGGAWNVTLKKDVDFQIIVSTPTQKFQEDLLTNVNELNKLIQNKIYIKNYNSCNTNFGRCDFYDLCHKGQMTDDLKKKDD